MVYRPYFDRLHHLVEVATRELSIVIHHAERFMPSQITQERRWRVLQRGSR
jgi:hypothetical protein